MGAVCVADVSSTFGVSAEGIDCIDSDNLNACVNGGEHTIRCADIAPGLACQSMGTSSFCGYGNECDPQG